MTNLMIRIALTTFAKNVKWVISKSKEDYLENPRVKISNPDNLIGK